MATPEPTPPPEMPSFTPFQPTEPAADPTPTPPVEVVPAFPSFDAPFTSAPMPAAETPPAPQESAPAATGSTTQKIVIAEDNPSLNEIYKTRLKLLGYQCFSAFDGEEALAIIERERPDLVLCDMMMPKVAGDQILARMRGSDWGRDIKVFIISNLSEADAPPGLREYGIEGYAVKANLSYDNIDNIVNKILRPEDQQPNSLLSS
jgi:CheY-like chemotaxis protein